MTPFDLSNFGAPLSVPELASGPVRLRPFAVTSVPAVYSDDAGRAFIERQHVMALEGHGYPFVIADGADLHQGLGAMGLWLRDIESGRASIGYWLVPAARGSHRARDALRALVAFAFDELAIPRLQLFIEPWNVASQRTAEAAGFTQEALLRGWERIGEVQHDAYCYALLHPGEKPL
jgi:[ribosomal protein S5]-alanine N-acetyltransferase